MPAPLFPVFALMALLLTFLPPPVHPHLNDLTINAESLREGIDFGHFNLRDISTSGRVGTIFHFTYSNGASIPDQFERPLVEGRSTDGDTIYTCTTNEAITSFIRKSFSIDGTHLSTGVEGSLSASFSDERKQVNNHDYYMFIQSATSDVYRLKLNYSTITLTTEFQRALQRQQSTNGTYDVIVNTYGTHYIRQAVFGGRKTIIGLINGQKYRTVVGSNTTLGGSLGGKIIAANVTASGKGQITFGSAADMSSEVFEYRRYCSAIGGLSSPCSSTTDNWVKLAHEYPRMIKVTLAPIYQLPQLQGHKVALKKATERYLWKVELLYKIQLLSDSLLKIHQVSETMNGVVEAPGITFYDSAVAILHYTFKCLTVKFYSIYCTLFENRLKALETMVSLIPLYEECAQMLTQLDYVRKYFKCQGIKPCCEATFTLAAKRIRSEAANRYRTLQSIYLALQKYATTLLLDHNTYVHPLPYTDVQISGALANWREVKLMADLEEHSESLYGCSSPRCDDKCPNNIFWPFTLHMPAASTPLLPCLIRQPYTCPGEKHPYDVFAKIG